MTTNWEVYWLITQLSDEERKAVVEIIKALLKK